jgi:hypothetical protein
MQKVEKYKQVDVGTRIYSFGYAMGYSWGLYFMWYASGFSVQVGPICLYILREW